MSTIPNTPESLDDQLSDSHVFAWLKPFNMNARMAFEHACDYVLRNDPESAHFRRFIHIEKAEDDTGGISSFTDDDTDIIEPLPPPLKPRWKGGYKLDLGVSPRVRRNGWVIGDARGLALDQIDLLLSSPRRVSSLAGRHARIYLHSESCHLTLESRHRVSIDGHSRDDVLKRGTPYVLQRAQQIIVGDNCVYTLNYSDFSTTSAFQSEIRKFMKDTHGSDWAMLNMLSPTPELERIVIGGYSWSIAGFARGTFGSVAAGVQSNGSAVAVKRIHKPRKGVLDSHKRMMNYLGRHPNLLTLLDCIENFENTEPIAYCIYSPLALGNLEDLRRDGEVPKSTQLALMYDYLRAVSYLHDEKKVMHRDIKPLNLGVATLNPPTGVIFDFDSVTLAQTSNNHMHGTVCFLAPEIVDIKKWDEMRKALAANGRIITTPRPPSYGKKVDMWALGLSAYLLYTDTKGYTTLINSTTYNVLQERIRAIIDVSSEDYVTTEYLTLISSMMEWSPASRKSASDALRSDFWDHVEKNEPKQDGSTCIKRHCEDDMSLATMPTKNRRSETMTLDSSIIG